MIKNLQGKFQKGRYFFLWLESILLHSVVSPRMENCSYPEQFEVIESFWGGGKDYIKNFFLVL